MSYRARAQGVSGRRIRVGAAFVAVLALAAVAAQFAGRPAQAGDAGDGRGRVGGVGGLVYVGRVADGDRDGRGEPVEIRGAGSLAVHDQGQALYLASELGLQVFRRDARSGRLDRVRTLAGGIDLSRAALVWDAAQGRLLADDCGTWRAFPLARGPEVPDGTELADGTDLIAEDDPYTCGHDLLIGADGASSYYRVGQGRVDVFASGPKDALRFAQTLEARGLSTAALHPNDNHLYALADAGLVVFERDGDTGRFAPAQAQSMLATPATALAVASGGTHMMIVERGGVGVFDLSNPALPRRVAAANLPAAVGSGGCRFAQAVPGAAAVDVFCPGAVLGAGWRTGGGTLETWSIVPENGDLAHPRDAMPPFGPPTAVAASPDGRHVYVATPLAGVLIFARGGGERAAVPRDAARPVAVRGRGRYSAQDESGPDFLIKSIQTVRTSFTGRQFKLKALAFNRADIANDEPTLRYYRSADASLAPADDTVVDSKTFDQGHGESIVWSKALEPESDAYYYACVDAMAGELDTTNNCSTAVFVSAGTAAATYRLAASATVSDAQPTTGATFDLTVTVSNEGNGRSPSAKLAYYQSDDSDISSGDQKLGETGVAQLDGGTSTTKTIAVTTPSSAGTHYYGACVTATVAASETGNNCSAGVRVDVVADSSSEPGDGAGSTYFDLDRLDGSPRQFAHAGDAIYVVTGDVGRAPEGDNKVYVYDIDGTRRAEEDFDLSAGGLPSGIAHAGGALYLVDWVGGQVYVYGTDGSRRAGQDFRLLCQGNCRPKGIAHAGDAIYVVGERYDKVYVYDSDGSRRADEDFDLDADNGSPEGIAHVGDTLYVADLDGNVYVYDKDGSRRAEEDFDLDWGVSDMSDAAGVLYILRPDAWLYVYGTDGSRRADEDVDLDWSNGRPSGIAHEAGTLYVADDDSRYVHAYGTDGARRTANDLRLSGVGLGEALGDYFHSLGITHSGTAVYVVGFVVTDFSLAGAKVQVYGTDGLRQPEAEFDLDPRNTRPIGIAHAEGALYVVDGVDKVYVYGTDGVLRSVEDFDFDPGHDSPVGIEHTGDALYVVDKHDDKVYAYGSDGSRRSAEDFYLDHHNDDPTDIVFAGDTFYVTDMDDNRVYVYPLSDDE